MKSTRYIYWLKGSYLGLLGVLFYAGIASAQSIESCPYESASRVWLEEQIQNREKTIPPLRQKIIRLIDDFLSQYSKAPERAEALFRLAEIHWEQAEADFLANLPSRERSIASSGTPRNKKQIENPGLDLEKSLRYYEEILREYPDFVYADMVLYLYAYGLGQKGNQPRAQKAYRRLPVQYPDSAFVPDAYFAIGEYQFSEGRYKAALESYYLVRRYDTPLKYLAIYKSAWCYFKQGKIRRAASGFQKILHSVKNQKQTISDSRLTMIGQLEHEVVEDLAMAFSESPRGARDAVRFMHRVGNPETTMRVLQSLGNIFFNQARYNQAIESYMILIHDFPLAIDNPQYHEKIAAAHQKSGDMEAAVRAHLQLVDQYGPGSKWLQHHHDREKLREIALDVCEQSLRFVATYRHKQAQTTKKHRDYLRSARSYKKYLKLFEASRFAPKMQYYLAEALEQLGRHREAAGYFQKAARKLGDKKQMLEASYSAVLALDRLRPDYRDKTPPTSPSQLNENEKRFTRAVDEFAELAPGDPRLILLRFEVGKISYYNGRYAEAVEQFVNLVQQAPKHELSQLAADLALDCYMRTNRYADLEKQAKQYEKSGIFKHKELGGKLRSFIVAAIFQQASGLAESGNHIDAATEYQRLKNEYPRDALAAKSLIQAAINFEKAHENQKARDCYLAVMRQYPHQAWEAMLALAGYYERRLDYSKSASLYERFSRRYPKNPQAPQALLQSAILYKASRNHQKEAEILISFNRHHPKHPKSFEALLSAAVALEKSGRALQSEQILYKYLSTRNLPPERIRRANHSLGKILLRSGKTRQAHKALDICAVFSPRSSPAKPQTSIVAECSFLLGEVLFQDYNKIKLQPPKNRLIRLLNQKAAILKKAEKRYTQAVATGDLEWTSAALYRIGAMYAQFSKAILKAPNPPGMNGKKLARYKHELEALAFPIEDKALRTLSINHEMTLKHNYHSRWSVQTIQLLQKLDPANHPKRDEIVPPTDWLDAYQSFPLILTEPDQSNFRGNP